MVAFPYTGHEQSPAQSNTALALTNSVSQAPFSFTRLPTEIRQKILAYTNLVPDYTDPIQCTEHGILIRNGRILRPIGSCYDHALFLVNKMLYEDSIYVFFSRNRFLLCADTSAANLAFLQKLSDKAMYAMRMIDVQLLGPSADRFAQGDSEEQRDFKAVVALVAAKCNFLVLHFALDSGWMNYDCYSLETRNWGELEWFLTTYRRLASAMKPLKGIRHFEVFLSYRREEEEFMEKEVMGDDYDALAGGKIHWTKRCPFDPHLQQSNRG